ncbi:MAG TPA: flagellar motor switch protein FliG [Candidatus Saccharimonadales bacterium]|nr:flagellar motor switch protein FliG [Candidatus Saccharimonadales bacterium]
MKPAPTTSRSGVRKAAILLVLLGEEVASLIFRHLNETDLQRVTQEISDIGTVDPDEAAAILNEYHNLAITQEYIAQGGTEYAKRLLVKTLGEDGARAMLEAVSRTQELSASKLDSLQKADPQQLAKFLQGEHPQTIALIMAHLDPKQASALLMKLTEETRAAAVKRLAELRQFSPEMAQKVSVVLHRRLQALGEQSRRAYAGFKGVADLLNRMDPTSAKAILEVIEQDDSKLAMSIRNLMFTFDDLLGVPETGIRELLSQLDKKTLAQALKGASNQLRDHLFKSMSSRAVEMLKEDMETLGPVRAKDVNKAQQECVSVARKLEAQGKIQLKQENEDELVV